MMFDLLQVNFFASCALGWLIIFFQAFVNLWWCVVKGEQGNRGENKVGQPCLNIRLLSIRFVTL